jgi:hypothetical protein
MGLQDEANQLLKEQQAASQREWEEKQAEALAQLPEAVATVRRVLGAGVDRYGLEGTRLVVVVDKIVLYYENGALSYHTASLSGMDSWVPINNLYGYAQAARDQGGGKSGYWKQYKKY